MVVAVVSAVREVDFKRHFSAEQEILELIFYFNHINHARHIRIINMFI